MTITILKLEAGQKIPRPMNRASSQDELVELLAYTTTLAQGKLAGGNLGRAMRLAKEAASMAAATPVQYANAHEIKTGNIDTEEPVMVHGSTKFYAFTEE